MDKDAIYLFGTHQLSCSRPSSALRGGMDKGEATTVRGIPVYDEGRDGMEGRGST